MQADKIEFKSPVLYYRFENKRGLAEIKQWPQIRSKTTSKFKYFTATLIVTLFY